ncbi:MAG: glycosyltransferase [Desulfuromonadales bacterium]|nr:glycosyltransferase [Desulfuromonadales bacterium]
MATFSIIIPVKPDGFIAALSSLRQMKAAGHSFEVLIAEGCSPSRQRNAAANEARGEIVYFLDDDSRVTPDCLTVCAQALEDETIAVAGGPSLTPSDDSQLQQLIGCALSSLLGAGAVRNRYRAHGSARITTEKELILCNLAMRRSAFLQSGGFDDRLYPNEENELLDRISTSGLKLFHTPEMAIQRSQRRTLRLFARQMFSYGRGRAQQTLITGHGSIISFAPLFFLIYLGLLPLLPCTAVSLAPLSLYGALVVLFSAATAVSSGKLSRLLLIPLYPLLHICNGYGLLCGLLGGKHGRSRAGHTESAITVRRIKEFGQSAW